MLVCAGQDECLRYILRVFRADVKSFFREVNALFPTNFVQVLQKTFLERILQPFSGNAPLCEVIDSLVHGGPKKRQIEHTE